MNTVTLSDVPSLELYHQGTFESIISQLQPLTQNVLICVQDGYKLLIFHPGDELPLDLSFVGNHNDMYYFRANKTQSLYTFFGEDSAKIVQSHLKSHNPDTIVAQIVKETAQGNQIREVASVKHTSHARISTAQISL